MVESSEFVNGAKVRWRELAVTLFGGVALAYYHGVIGFILSIQRSITGLIDGLSSFFAQVVSLLVGGPALIIEGSYTATVQAAGSAGLVAFVLSVVVVLALVWTIEQGVRQL